MVDEAQNVANTIKKERLDFHIRRHVSPSIYIYSITTPIFGLDAKMSCLYLFWNPFGFDNMKISQPNKTLVENSKSKWG